MSVPSQQTFKTTTTTTNLNTCKQAIPATTVCAANVPEERPVIEEVLERLHRMRVEVEGGYGSSMVKLDIHKVLLLKEMKMKERRNRGTNSTSGVYKRTN